MKRIDVFKNNSTLKDLRVFLVYESIFNRLEINFYNVVKEINTMKLLTMEKGKLLID